MYKYILVCTYTCLDVQTKNSMYWYVLVCTDHVTGFRGKHRDAAMLDSQPEVNPWLWQFGRGKPRLGGLSVEDTQERKAAASAERRLRAVETRRRRKADRA